MRAWVRTLLDQTMRANVVYRNNYFVLRYTTLNLLTKSLKAPHDEP